MTNQLLCEIAEARVALGGLGRSTIYELVNTGELKLVKIGRRSFITAESIEAFVGRLTND